MKYQFLKFCHLDLVAPHAGAWVEIELTLNEAVKILVAPHAGAWVEIVKFLRGDGFVLVAPHAGAWVEILKRYV